MLALTGSIYFAQYIFFICCVSRSTINAPASEKASSPSLNPRPRVFYTRPGFITSLHRDKNAVENDPALLWNNQNAKKTLGWGWISELELYKQYPLLWNNQKAKKPLGWGWISELELYKQYRVCLFRVFFACCLACFCNTVYSLYPLPGSRKSKWVLSTIKSRIWFFVYPLSARFIFDERNTAAALYKVRFRSLDPFPAFSFRPTL